jgi:hypothetical protein
MKAALLVSGSGKKKLFTLIYTDGIIADTVTAEDLYSAADEAERVGYDVVDIDTQSQKVIVTL